MSVTIHQRIGRFARVGSRGTVRRRHWRVVTARVVFLLFVFHTAFPLLSAAVTRPVGEDLSDFSEALRVICTPTGPVRLDGPVDSSSDGDRNSKTPWYGHCPLCPTLSSLSAGVLPSTLVPFPSFETTVSHHCVEVSFSEPWRLRPNRGRDPPVRV
jgi:hypothetical protein